MRSAIRMAVCPVCFVRPAGSEKLGDRRRECEGECAIFANLAQLREMAGRVHAGQLRPYQSALHEMLCGQCECEAAGASCDNSGARQCPLNRHLREVVGALDDLCRQTLSA